MTHEEIRRVLMEGCSEELLKAIHCPVCGGGSSFHVHPRGKSFVIRCDSDTTHMHLSDTNPSPPDWWSTYIERGVWTADW
ncbi:hypothetical protein [Paludisphaera soli]|uniref:hypothetical protein n=1 Tax=Paludisphaera soli TaxID=2712865 RepID=UPI0013E9D36E|nr:hypothetical protein [Paludisphaera soli]